MPPALWSLLRLALGSRLLSLHLPLEFHPHLVSLNSFPHLLPVPHLTVVRPKDGADGDARRQTQGNHGPPRKARRAWHAEDGPGGADMMRYSMSWYYVVNLVSANVRLLCNSTCSS
jgi:hypothetical protein